MTMQEGGVACVHVEDLSKYLDSLLSKLPKKNQNFMLIDVNENSLYTPKTGFYECKDIPSLKMFVQRLLGKLNVDRIYIGKGMDEKWLEEHLHVILQAKKPDNISPLLLGKILNIIPTRRKRLLLKTRVDPTLILNAIEVYSKI